MSYTDQFENKLHDFLNRGQSLTIGAVTATWSAAPTFYIGLLEVVGNDAGGHTECSWAGYARIPVVAGFATITGTDGGTVGVSTGTSGGGSNADIIEFAEVTASPWATIAGFARFDASTGGNIIDKVAFAEPLNAVTGTVLRFVPGAMLVNVDD